MTDWKPRNVGAGRGKRIELRALTETVAEIKHVLRSQVVIDPNSKLVVIGSKDLRAEVGRQALIGVRVKGQEVLRNRIDRIRAEKIVEIVERHRRGLGCEEKQELAILQGSVTLHTEAVGVKGSTAAGAQKAKVAGAFRIGRHGGAGCFPLTVAKPLVVAEEEGFVLLDGTTEGCTKLVAMKRLDGSGEENSLASMALLRKNSQREP